MRSSMTDSDYHMRADALLNGIEAQVDAWLQADVIDIDAQRSGGVLELRFPNGSQIILNKQAPLQELWLASRAGGYHFAWVEGDWRDTKTSERIAAVFSTQASAQAGRPLVLEQIKD